MQIVLSFHERSDLANATPSCKSVNLETVKGNIEKLLNMGFEKHSEKIKECLFIQLAADFDSGFADTVFYRLRSQIPLPGDQYLLILFFVRRLAREGGELKLKRAFDIWDAERQFILNVPAKALSGEEKLFYESSLIGLAESMLNLETAIQDDKVEVVIKDLTGLLKERFALLQKECGNTLNESLFNLLQKLTKHSIAFYADMGEYFFFQIRELSVLTPLQCGSLSRDMLQRYAVYPSLDWQKVYRHFHETIKRQNAEDVELLFTVMNHLVKSASPDCLKELYNSLDYFLGID